LRRLEEERLRRREEKKAIRWEAQNPIGSVQSECNLRRQVMKELDVFLKTVVEGMKSMAQGIEVLAEKLDTIAKSRVDVTPKRKANAKPARKAPAKSSKKKAAQKASKTAVSKKEKTPTAVDTVLAIVSRSKKGVNTAILMEKTGYDQKKISNLLYKLKKQGKIKSVNKGVYLKA